MQKRPLSDFPRGNASAVEIAAICDASLTSAYNWRKLGVPSKYWKRLGGATAPYVRCEKEARSDVRAEQMRDMYLTGRTLQQIGKEFGVTRERVRQILSRRFGIRYEDSGAASLVAFKAAAKAKARQDAKDQRFFSTYGGTAAEVVALNGGESVSTKGSLAFRYAEHRKNAGRRAIPWRFTFAQWLQVWIDSGKLGQRGRGQGYCMARIGDTGAYEPGNVEIITIGQNFSDSFMKTSALERLEKSGRRYPPFRVSRCGAGFQLFIGHPRKYAGYFKTEAAATARGLELTAAA